MTGNSASSTTYRAEHRDDIIVEALDMITLVYQRRSGITHMVTEPMPQILTAFGDDVLTIDELTQRLADQFDLGDDPINTQSILSARLQELEALGLVLALRNTAQDNGDA